MRGVIDAFIERPRGHGEPVTKFGGQPQWVTSPQWPLSAVTGNQMRFIGQVVLESIFFPEPELCGRIVYIFMTSEDEYVDDTWDPYGGENAVIVQPGLFHGNYAPLAEGPGLYDYEEIVGARGIRKGIGGMREWHVTLRIDNDVVCESITGLPDDVEKGISWIGGTPKWLQSPEVSLREWRLVLQLCSTRVPFEINFGDAGVGYVFVNRSGTQGILLWQSV